jgi:hypothetical protein
MTRRYHHDIQGRFLGIPYDFRWPTWSKVVSRMYNPRATIFTPKVFGLGWTINLARRGTWAILLAALLLTMVLSCFT